MCIVEKCCCCLKLTTGGYILGVLGAIDSVISFIVTATLLAHYDEIITGNQEKEPEVAKALLENKSMFIVILLAFLVLCVVLFVGYVLLVRGTFKRNPKLIVPSLIIFGAGIVLLCFSFIFYLFLEHVLPEYILALGLLLALNIYIWICIYSLYKSLKSFQTV